MQTINAASKVSIGMPVFNGEKYIREALDSLLTQTFTDFELIISDNASTDDTQAICEEYSRRDPRILYTRQIENMGILFNFQFVLDKAKGEYFMWAAADDRWDANWIESVYTHLLGKKCTACFAGLKTIDSNGKLFYHPADRANLSFSGHRLWRKLSFFLSYEGFGKANLIYSLYPRALLQDLSMHEYSFDYLILFSLLDKVTFEQIKGPNLYKRIHDANEGVQLKNYKHLSVIDIYAKGIVNTVKTATNYLKGSEQELWTCLLLLVPIKIIVSIFIRLTINRTR